MVTSPLSTSPPGEPLACKQCGNAIEVGINFCPLCGTAVQGEAVPDPLVGRVVAERYRIMQLIGRGGMGVVYKVEHTRMGKIMAIKLLHGDLARDQEVQRRFKREAQAASRLSHPSTVSIFDFGWSDGLMYLVMEYVSGEDLGKLLRGAGHLPPARVAALAVQACGSLAEAHEQGIIHRDLKPENLLISPLRDGRDLVKLLDFGLAKLREGEDRNEITSAGTLIGTPYYMAPEVIRGQPVDHRVDIYAIGAVLYRAIAGAPAFTGTSPVAVLTRHLTDEVVPPSKRRPELKIPAAIDEVVLRCMRKEAGERYQQIDEVREALTEYLVHEGLADSLLRDSSLTTRNSSQVGAALDSSRPSRNQTGKHNVATRGDVEEFERKLRRNQVAGYGAAAVLGVSALAGATLLWRQQVVEAQRPRDAEVEPNNAAAQATLIAPDLETRGRIGQRLAIERGDVDYYRLTPVPPGRWRIRVELGAVPTVDTVVELLEEGRTAAVAVSDGAGPGGREVIPNFRVEGGGRYYLSVHEKVRPGALPTETISDYYALRYTLARVTPGEEVEPNDREEIAADITPEVPQRGYLESADDADCFCLAQAPTAPLRVRLVAPTSLDLELVVRPRDGAVETVVDARPEGGEESAQLAAQPAGTRGPCLIVRGSTARRAEVHGDPDRAYTLQVTTP